MAYREFVKNMYPTLANTALSATEKIKEIAKQYQEKKSNSATVPKAKELKVAKPKATKPLYIQASNHSIGVMKMSHSLRNQLIEKGSFTHGGELTLPMNTSNYWVYPIPAELKGVPSYLLQHPNKYSGSKSQIMLYSSYEDFMQTDTYKNNMVNIKTITPPPKFAQSNSSDAWLDHVAFVYGKELRVIFVKGDLEGQGVVGLNGNFRSYYLDVPDIKAYVELLMQIYKDRDTLQPVEAAAIKRMAKNAADAQTRYTTSMGDRKYGADAQKATDDADAAAASASAASASAQQSNDDDSGSGSIWGQIGDVALSVLPFFL